jgi:acetylornithine/succinyldiaminopimelate/putrescine aminotransferase
MGRSAEGEALLREREDLVKARAESQKDAEALRVLVEEGMIENAAVQGARFLDGLRRIRANTIREVRGRGLIVPVVN